MPAASGRVMRTGVNVSYGLASIAAMRILVVHAWLKGNVGDVLQLSVLVGALRALKPEVLDLAGCPAEPADNTREIVSVVDTYVPEPFEWYWKYSPNVVRSLLLEPRWKKHRRALFSRYNAIISAPGPFLAEYDARLPSALSDIALAGEIGIPFLLSSHSIGPLPQEALARLGKVAACVAREKSTHQYLLRRGIQSVLSADLAFLYPYEALRGREPAATPVDPPYRLVFLRCNNLEPGSFRRDQDGLRSGSIPIAGASGERIVLATSDVRRDGRFLASLSNRLGIPWTACQTVSKLVHLVDGSAGVVSDRYHPAICAAVLGKPSQILQNREPHKMEGLQTLLAEHSLSELQGLAQAGLTEIRAALRRAGQASPRAPSERSA